MTKLGQLREAEEKAQQEIDRAEKEAHRIRMSIPDLMEEQTRRYRDRLEELERSGEQEVAGRIEELSRNLEKETESRLKELSSHGMDLESAAEERLRGIILDSGKK
ncbi:MAG: hypothetical protein AVO35_01590 [Candidatus Aegiribacteria sp. MLS_C]|nr:MAG: hypothetical protein AVO35_01590 [Candidatus Aegiribacteria sp. MLS_C]